jgi:hypothetical protein
MTVLCVAFWATFLLVLVDHVSKQCLLYAVGCAILGPNHVDKNKTGVRNHFGDRLIFLGDPFACCAFKQSGKFNFLCNGVGIKQMIVRFFVNAFITIIISCS